MRYLRKQVLNRRAPYDQRLQIDVNNSVLMSTPTALQLPAGTSTERPINSNRYGTSNVADLNGMIRYNTQTNQLEGNQNGIWRAFRFKEATQIVSQTLGVGNSIDVLFGPLSPSPPATVESEATWSGANILVIVENVIQIFTTNYSISVDPVGYATGSYVLFDSPVPSGKAVTVLHGFDK